MFFFVLLFVAVLGPAEAASFRGIYGGNGGLVKTIYAAFRNSRGSYTVTPGSWRKSLPATTPFLTKYVQRSGSLRAQGSRPSAAAVRPNRAIHHITRSERSALADNAVARINSFRPLSSSSFLAGGGRQKTPVLESSSLAFSSSRFGGGNLQTAKTLAKTSVNSLAALALIGGTVSATTLGALSLDQQAELLAQQEEWRKEDVALARLQLNEAAAAAAGVNMATAVSAPATSVNVNVDTGARAVAPYPHEMYFS